MRIESHTNPILTSIRRVRRRMNVQRLLALFARCLCVGFTLCLPLFVVDESALAMAADISVSNSFQPGPLGPAPPVSKGGGKKWLWLLLAAGAAGGAAVALGGGDATSPGTGSVGISVVVP